MPSKKTFITLISLVTCSFFFTKPAHADFNLGVYPPLTTITTDAPYDVNAPITITNSGDQPVDLDVQIKPFIPSPDDNGVPLYVQQFSGSDAQIAQKIHLQMDNEDISSLTLPPGASRTLSLIIHIPDQEPDGEYYFSVLFISKGQLSDQSTSSGISGGIATNVILHIGNPEKPSGSIEDFSTSSLIQSGPVKINLTVNNSGSIFFAPQGVITIKNTFGQTVDAFQTLPVNILTKSSRAIPAKGQESSNSTAPIIWTEKALVGIYSINLKMKFSEDGPNFDKTIYFVALPWPVIALIIGLSLLTLAITLRVRQRIKAK